MRVTALCISEDNGEYDSKKGSVKYHQIALLDQDPVVEARMVNTFDYRLSPDEKEKFAGKCIGRQVVVDVKDWAIFNSRPQAKQGKIISVQGNGK